MRRLFVLLGIALVMTGCSLDRRHAPANGVPQRDDARKPEVTARFQAAPPTTSNTAPVSF